MRLGEARGVLGLTAESSPEDARRAYRRLALTAHPDKNASPDATERFQRIQDAFTRIQASEESGRGGASDDEDDEDDDYDDDYYDEYEAFEEAVRAARTRPDAGWGQRAAHRDGCSRIREARTKPYPSCSVCERKGEGERKR
jgi:molecular chaperone DnaJ